MSAPTDEIIVSTDGPVRVITLNRPDAKNAFSEPMHRIFLERLRELDEAAGVRAIVLTGAGSAFCAGGSLDDFATKRDDFAARSASLRTARRIVNEMLDVHVPIVGAVNGHAVGLGCTLATLCDVVYVSEDAFFCDPHVAVALVAGDGAGVTWPHLMSLMRAKQYLLTGDRIPAAEAVALGMANFVVPADEALPQAIAFAERLAALPPQAVQDTKAMLNQHLRQSVLLALGYGLAAESQSHDTVEYRDVADRGASKR